MDKREDNATAPLVLVGLVGVFFWWFVSQGHKYVPPEHRVRRF